LRCRDEDRGKLWSGAAEWSYLGFLLVYWGAILEGRCREDVSVLIVGNLGKSIGDFIDMALKL